MREGQGRVARAVVVVAAGLAAATTIGVLPAIAGTVAKYAGWTVSGDSGTLSVPGGGLPDASFTSNSTTLRNPSGKSAFLGSQTPFGQEFGSSEGHDYLSFGTAAGKKPSKTRITFDFPATGTWGFALGDIDADEATIIAEGPDGKELTAAELGWQGAFNYCQNSPKPSACTRPPFTDVPAWDPATLTLRGHTADTDGASGWFMPAKPVKSLTIVFNVLSGIPIGQLWIAAKWNEEKPNVIIDIHASPQNPLPGDTVDYAVTVHNDGTAADPRAEFKDDLSNVLDDARYNHDAHASRGTVSFEDPYLYWHGPVDPGQTATITYSVTLYDTPGGNGRLTDRVVGEGPRDDCQLGRGSGCAAVIVLRNLCRAVAGAGVRTPVRVARNEC
jgi:uncharacterized repeat protein (TIGR01451 family)